MTASTPGDRSAAPTRDHAHRGPAWWRHRWLRHLLGLALLLGVLMGLARPVQVTPAPVTASRLVIVGVGERGSLTPVDREVLDTRSASSAYGVVATDRYADECVSAAWLSLGAGRLAHTDDQCELQVTLAPEVRLGQEGGAAVSNWAAIKTANPSFGVELGIPEPRIAAAADGVGDRCISAVGPGAALAAADSEGALSHYSDLTSWRERGLTTACRVTIVDAAAASDDLIRRLVDDQQATVIVLGLGAAGPLENSAPGVSQADKLSLSSVQLAYRVDPDGTGLPGRLSSDTTREPGVITLPDVSATITRFLQPTEPDRSADTPVAGTPVGVIEGPVSASEAAELLRLVSVLQGRRPILLVFGGVLVALLVATVVLVVRRRWSHTRLLGAALTTWPVALLSAGMVPWYATGAPILAGSATVLGAWLLATVVARLLTVPRRPAAIAGASLALALTASSAALGDAWQVGTLLDSTTALGPDWVGIGPGAAAVCVGSAITIAAWWADRLPKRQSVVAIVALMVVVGIVLLPNVTYVIALLCGGAVLTFADTARSWVRAAIPWADPLFAGSAAATLVAALVGTVLLFVDSGVILLHMAPETPLFGGILMAWFGSVTLALWLQMRARDWFAARDAGELPGPSSL